MMPEGPFVSNDAALSTRKRYFHLSALAICCFCLENVTSWFLQCYIFSRSKSVEKDAIINAIYNRVKRNTEVTSCLFAETK